MAEQTSRLAIILDSSGAKRSADTLATSLERLTTQGEKASTSTDDLGVSFKRLAASAAGALSIGVVIKTVDEWGQVAARIKNALKSVEGDIKNYSMLQERFLEISNRNGKNIADTQLLYIGAATSMQELGYSTEQTVDYIESLSSSMTANASSVNEVLSMQNALNKAMVAGKVAGENWNSIMNATPTLLGDIAKQLEKQNGGVKVTEMEVKKLAADGKISFKLFADAVMAAKDANNALADSMDNTVADGLTRVTNSAKAYYGELNQSLGITRSMSAGLAALSNNFDSVSVVLTSVVGIGAARYISGVASSLKVATSETINQSKALKANAKAQLDSNIQSQRRAQAEVRNAQLDRARLQNNINQNNRSRQSALLSAEITAAQQRERAAKLALVQANNAVAASQERINTANSLGARAAKIAGAGLSLIGGPVGLAMLAAGGIYAYTESMRQSREEAIEFAESLNQLKDSLEKLSRAELSGKIAEAKDKVDTLTDAEEAAKKKVDDLVASYKAYETAIIPFGNRQEYLERISRDLAKAESDLEKIQNNKSKTLNFISASQAQLNGTLLQGADLLTRQHSTLPNVASAWKSFGFDVNAAANALGKFNAESLLVKFSTPETASFFKNLDRQLELSNKSARDRFIANARFSAKDAGASKEEIKLAEKTAGIIYDQEEAQRKLLKTQNATYSESAAQKLIGSLKEQQAVLNLQSKTNDKLGSQEQARAKFLDEIAQIKGKKQLTADQKSLLANEALIKAEFDKNVQLEQHIKNREAEAKIAAYNKQLMEETAQAQRAYDMELQGAGAGNLARSRLQEKLRLEDEYRKKQAELQKQFQDSSSGITQEMYEKETQIIKGELDKRILMMQGYHAEQDVLRENWQLGIQESLLNYIDEASNYNQIAADAVTNILNTTTSAISTGFTDMINGTKSVGDAFSDMASGMGQAVIQQLTQMAAQWLAYQTVQMMVSKTTQSSASAGLTANAQAASQMAGLNAYASTAAIPIFGPAMAPAAMAAAITATQPLALTISALSTAGLTGMAHSGIDKVPQTGTWLLEKGERVMTQNTSARLDKMLEDLSKSMTPDQYAMKNIHPDNQTTNNSSEENSTKVITIHAAPITIQGNPDDKTIALIEQSQRKAIMDCYKAISNDLAEGKGNVSKALGTGWNTKRKTG